MRETSVERRGGTVDIWVRWLETFWIAQTTSGEREKNHQRNWVELAIALPGVDDLAQIEQRRAQIRVGAPPGDGESSGELGSLS